MFKIELDYAELEPMAVADRRSRRSGAICAVTGHEPRCRCYPQSADPEHVAAARSAAKQQSSSRRASPPEAHAPPSNRCRSRFTTSSTEAICRCRPKAANDHRMVDRTSQSQPQPSPELRVVCRQGSGPRTCPPQCEKAMCCTRRIRRDELTSALRAEAPDKDTEARPVLRRLRNEHAREAGENDTACGSEGDGDEEAVRMVARIRACARCGAGISVHRMYCAPCADDRRLEAKHKQNLKRKKARSLQAGEIRYVGTRRGMLKVRGRHEDG